MSMMKRLRPFLSASAVALATVGIVSAYAQTQPPGGSISSTETITATVTKIDKKDRWVTLKMADGKLVDLHIGPVARNFDQVNVGDRVTARQQDTVDITVIPPGQAAPNVSGGSSMVGAPAGSKPLGVKVDTVVITGRVTAIDHDQRLVTLLGPLGNSHTIEVGSLAARLNEIKTGDSVQVTLKSSTMIEVTAPAKK
ncbi:MAG: hypothetical protein R3F24_02720 [Gammaproteobacteria bacterium]